MAGGCSVIWLYAQGRVRHLRQMLEGARHRGQRFKRGQRAEHEQGNQCTRRAIGADAAGGQPQQQRNGTAGDQRKQALRQRLQPVLLLLRLLPRTFFLIQPLSPQRRRAVNLQLGLSPEASASAAGDNPRAAW